MAKLDQRGACLLAREQPTPAIATDRASALRRWAEAPPTNLRTCDEGAGPRRTIFTSTESTFGTGRNTVRGIALTTSTSPTSCAERRADAIHPHCPARRRDVRRPLVAPSPTTFTLSRSSIERSTTPAAIPYGRFATIFVGSGVIAVRSIRIASPHHSVTFFEAQDSTLAWRGSRKRSSNSTTCTHLTLGAR